MDTQWELTQHKVWLLSAQCMFAKWDFDGKEAGFFPKETSISPSFTLVRRANVIISQSQEQTGQQV